MDNDKEIENKEPKLANAQFTIWDMYYPQGYMRNLGVWSPEEYDKLDENPKTYHKLVKQCKFYYKKDPIGGTIINKLVELGITELIFDKGKLSENEFRVFDGMRKKIKKFIEACALEYLLSGLVVPEIKYTATPKTVLQRLGIKKYTTLALPNTMWLRDPATMKINSSMVLDDPSYYVILPEELVFFIQNKGQYPDGNKDLDLYQKLLQEYPEFVSLVIQGNKEVLLDNPLVIRRKVLSDSPYPIPYLAGAVEAMRHKRNLRRMDYSLASRVITAIQLFKLGNDEYPVTDQGEFDALEAQIKNRGMAGRDVERIFQLFANHTLEISWVLPPVDVLLDDTKYTAVNQDIFFSLGFPRILTTGETERSNSSQPELATMSPVKTMENMQEDLLEIVENILDSIAELNDFRDKPTFRFASINLREFKDFAAAMKDLYDTANISRTSYAKLFGYNWDDEVTLRADEDKKMKELEVGEFAPRPFSPSPTNKEAIPTEKPKEQNPPTE